MKGKAFAYGRKKRLNTEIGGVSATIITASDLATILDIPIGRINDFVIVGTDVKCNITGNYEIPVNAFRSNTSLTSFIDNDGLVTKINNSAFYNCTSATNYNFPNVSNIESSSAGSANGTFQNNTSLISLSFPSLTVLSGTGSCFFGCSNLTTFSAPIFSNSIPNATFYFCYVLEFLTLTINGDVSDGAFAYCQKITSVDLTLATSIGTFSFGFCILLEGHITANNSLSIGDSAFASTKITGITANSCTVIGESCFRDLNTLTTVNLPNLLTINNGVAFNTGAFQNCNGITDLSFPLLTSINGTWCFESMLNITSISMPSLTTLGNTTGDDSIFAFIKTNCSITVPLALATVSGGSPDGDLVYAITSRTATVTYV
jgi:hypothetical protein